MVRGLPLRRYHHRRAKTPHKQRKNNEKRHVARSGGGQECRFDSALGATGLPRKQLPSLRMRAGTNMLTLQEIKSRNTTCPGLGGGPGLSGDV